MIAALFYLQYHSTKNRLVARFKRLKQPKYLVGALVGAVYFYFYFFRLLFHARSRGGAASGAFGAAGDPLLYESLGALVLLVVVLLAWLWPNKRAALAFTEAEVAFLFPAPISRRGLIHFKLLRSQLGIVLSILFLALITNRYGAGSRALLRAGGWWLILSTLNLHFLGASFTRTMLLDRGITNWQRRLGVLALVAAALGIVGAWVARTLPPLTTADLADLDRLKDCARQVLVSGPTPYLLYPFRLVVRPCLAPDAAGFLKSVWPALLLLALHYGWVVRANVAFEEASVEASQKLAERIAAARRGHWRTTGQKPRRKRAPFRLAPTGPPATAVLWKNLIAAGQAFTLRIWLVLAATVFGLSAGLRSAAGGSNWLLIVGVFAATLGGWALLIGPQVVRQDFRQDLAHADILKLYPLRGWQVALGEILAPAVILTGIQWLLLIVAVGFFSQARSPAIPGSLVAGFGLGAALLLPMLNLISLLIPNAAVLLFPAWFQAGRDGPHGLEATGQRLIFALGQFLAFAVALIPAAAVFAGLFLLVRLAVSASAAVPVAAAVAALVLAVEAGLGVMLLGRVFERLDVSAEPAV